MKKIIIVSLSIFFFSLPISSKNFLPTDINFNVYRNGNLIGYHKINFQSDRKSIKAIVEIKFEVTFLGFVLYEYFHKNTEIWKNNSLIQLNTETDKNGDLLNCNLRESTSAFLIEGSFGNESVNSSPIPTSYWNKILVEKSDRKVLNTQDCSYINFKITYLGEERIYNNSLIVNHYKLIGNEITGEVVDIDIWYNDSNEWVKMVFVKDGSKIEYILEKYDSDQ